MLSLGSSVWLVLSLLLLLGFIRYFETPYLPQLAKRIVGEKTAAFWTGNVSAAAALGGVLAGAICGYLADKLSPNKLIVPALVVGGAAVFWQASATTITSVIVARFVAYLAVGGIAPIFLTLITKITAKEKQGLVFGLNTTAENVGIMLSTLFSGGVIYYTGVQGVFQTTALLYFAFIPYVIFANTKIKKELIP